MRDNVLIMNRVLIRHIILTLMTAAQKSLSLSKGRLVLMLFLLMTASAVKAQSDSPYVIKVRQSDHYLAHVKVGGQYVVQDTIAFSPSCLWYSGIEQNISGTNHNYYFIDENGKYRYLTTSMGKNKTPGLSDDLPMTYLLSNTDTIYYFYDWDPEIKISGEGEGGGVARGHQYTEFNAQTPCEDCGHSWGDSQCWDVFWLVYKDGSGWKTPGASYYDIDSVPSSEGIGGRFHKVTVTNHPKEIVTVSSGALANLDNWAPTAVGNKNYSVTASSFTYNYIPEYNQYAFREMQINGNDSTFHVFTYYFAGNTLVTTPPPAQQTATGVAPSSYQWTITGDAAQFLSFASSGTLQHTVSGDITGSSQTLDQTLYYVQENQTGDKTAVLKLVVTYEDGSTQERTATVTLATSCQNPPEAAAPIVSHDDVLVTWYNIASKYQLQWRKTASSTWSDPVEVVPSDPAAPTVSYPIIDLEHDTEYTYRVTAYCNGAYLVPPASTGTFTTREEHELLVYGAVFGGGRMADVKGRTEVVVINCDSIGAVYGGNDIAGAVRDSSIITLGVNSGGDYSSYGTTSAALRVGDVYGGGNGYYCYGSNSFSPIGSTQTTVSIAASATTPPAADACVLGFSVISQEWNDTVWVNKGTAAATLNIPSISKTSIVVANDFVKIDSLFGGAKNAFVTYNDANHNADSIIIDGGTLMAVFGGNNVGGSQGAGKHFVKVNHTTTNLQGSIVNTATTGYGRDFGIRYLFGGGNKVTASTTDVVIMGGQLDTIFAGGNSADVAGANITVNCPFGTMVGDYTFGNVYSNAIDPSVYTGSFSGDCIKDSYSWNGLGGIYNVRTLFGGNNHADMSVLPTLNLTSGSVGTVYGGGNAGNMNAEIESYNTALAADFGPIYTSHDPVETSPINISTHVVLSSANMLVDYLYGGCQMSNVNRGTWVEMTDGHVGTVYGGCNISGDVGSQYLFSDAYSYRPRHLRYQAVRGATYVKVSGGHVYNDLFAGSNGRYHCNNGKVYIEGIDFDDIDAEGRYLGMSIPTHNETHVYVSGGEIGGSVYAGGNLACVGFINETQPESFYTPVFVGMATVRMDGGHVHGNVFGGGNMASIWGSNAVAVQGGIIDGALYGGNDRIGLVAQITNRVLPPDYGFASDTYTSLADVRTYVSLTGRPVVNTVYGGGNGDYDDYQTGQYCNPNDQPVQSNTFVDVNIDGYADGTTQGGHIGTVYGGGNGVTVTGTTVVFLNVRGEGGGEPTAYDHVGTIFGGNNKGPLAIVPEIILLKGQVNTVYGGCNQGAMVGGKSIDTYNNIGSMVRLRNEYKASYSAPMVVPTAKVSNAVYGGCRMNGVTNNSLVLVEGGVFGDTVGFFGGSDISGIISGTSRVVVKAGTHGNGPAVGNAFGGGNGNYDYVGDSVYVAGSTHTLANLIATSDANIARPACNATQVDMIGGTAANLYGGGNAAGVTTTSTVNMNGGNVTVGIYGGCCSMDTIHGDVAINVLGGIVGTDATDRADIFGGGYGQHTRTDGNVTVNFGDASHAPALYGDIYGGSALGHVNDTMVNGISAHTTTVNILNGNITGDVYGGGLGQYTDNQHDSIAALVNGKVYVNIGAYTNGTYSGNVTFNTYGGATNDSLGGRVYGANNVFGTPLDSVFVNIYKTAHGADYTENKYPDAPSGGWTVANLATNAEHQAYAIQAVYGGGNLAAYTPNLSATDGRRSATVHVYQCKENTVRDVFGGGNAADVGTADKFADTYVIVDGGRLHRVIGGGNGEKLSLPAANIYGAANTTVYSGLIDEVYGGANMQGSVDAINLVVSHPEASQSATCADQVYGKVFGCANAAPYNRSVTTTIKCGVGEIGELYGGSNQASIGIEGQNNADVTLNLYGGTHEKVFAGSKGIAAASGVTPVEANIYGNVTLNLYGGTVTHAFGGSDANGNIAGVITVNVLDEEGSCPLDVTNIYGASNLTAYEPDSIIVNSVKQAPVSPVINVVHIKNIDLSNVVHGVRGNIYGGGNEAHVKSNPMVNIGYHSSSMSSLIPTDYPIDEANRRAYVSGNVFGGGNLAAVTGTDTINMRVANSHVNRLFGGGNEAGTTNTVVNVYDGEVVSAIYGGCNEQGTVTGDIDVNIYGGTLGTSSVPMPEGIFGGGKGGYVNPTNQGTKTDGDVTVTIGDGTDPTIYADIYGGSAFGEVGATGKLAKVDLKNGTVYGTIFGGGKGQLEDNNTNPVTPAYSATVSGSTEVAIEGGSAKGFAWGTGVNEINAAVFGGCNVNGTVIGNATVSYTGGTIGTDANHSANVYGGGLGENTKVKGNVAVTVNNADGDVYGDVYGGSAKGKVNCNNEGTAQQNYSKTNVTLTAGTIHGNLYGGGHGLEDHAANVYGPVTVNVNGGTVTNVFGCNNVKGAPMDSVVLNVTAGTIDSIFGGGNVAAYVAPNDARDYPEINISGGNIIYKVVGGGNNIANNEGINGNPHVNISGGTVCTVETGLKAGVYGGCNTQGRVTGDIVVNITGGEDAAHHTTIGTMAALQNGKPVSVHGGGYGAGTSTIGNVTVNFGTDEEGTGSAHCEWPMLYGDMYGGSALGHVNAEYGTNTTTVNVLNGSVKYYQETSQSPQYGGNIYGGGLGQVAAEAIGNPGDPGYVPAVPAIEAKEHGEVHVNIGGVTQTGTVIGKASLKHCNVYGCNNLNGSPQKDVFVDVYQTNHTPKDLVTYYESSDREYAIRNVFGGGNQADYEPLDVSNRAHNYIHFCDNTINNVYGGGNAAAALGVDVDVDGGRFEYIFGGGNGQVVPADIGEGGIDLMVCSGRVGYKYVGCDAGGNVLGTMQDRECDQNPKVCPDNLIVEYFFFGANKATIIGGLRDTIFCHTGSGEDPMHYHNVYAGSRLAVIYGDIYIVVRGGEIMNLFGGSQGSAEHPGHVRRFPSTPEEYALVPADATAEMQQYMQAHPQLAGQGGNIYMQLEGGTLHNVYGGNQLYGDVDGDIIIIVNSNQDNCTLSIDTLYGGNEQAVYHPYESNNEPRVSPKVYIKNGTVNYDVFGGSMGDLHHTGEIQNAGRINSYPYVIVGGDETNDVATIGRDLFGGGSEAKVIGNTKVVLRGKTTINGDVFGGSKQGDVEGNTDVEIEPASCPQIAIPAPSPLIPHILTLAVSPDGAGAIEVTDNHGNEVTSGASIPEGSVLHITARAAAGYQFSQWSSTVTGEPTTPCGTVTRPNSYSTSLIMGTQNTTLTATFTPTP